MFADNSRALARWGEALRRARAARERMRASAGYGFAAGLAAGLLVAGAANHARPLLVWNASASEAEGLYRIGAPAALGIGDLVVAWAPPPARRLAGERGYLPQRVPLVKRIAARGGDRICGEGLVLLVNGRARGVRLTSDSRGRRMPTWNGCRVVAPGEYLLLGEGPRSFDGRYFGTVEASAIVGRAGPLWLS